MHLGEEIRVKREAMGLSLEELTHHLLWIGASFIRCFTYLSVLLC